MDRYRLGMGNIKYILIVSFLLISFFGISQEKYVKHVREADTLTMLVGATKTDGVARLALTNGVDTVFISNKSDTINFTGYSIIYSLNVNSLNVNSTETDELIVNDEMEELSIGSLTITESIKATRIDADVINVSQLKFTKQEITTSQIASLTNYHYFTVTTGSNIIELTLQPSGVSRVIIDKKDSGVGWVKIIGNINGRSEFYLSKQYDLIELIYDGSEFKIVNLYLE